jgi:hypothetical protein
VSFFVTSRLPGQAGRGAFLNAMIEQVESLYPAMSRLPEMAEARVGVWWGALAMAGARASEIGRQLIVVVDGLDEDEAGAAPTRGQHSIASLLPRRPPVGVRFIITSRPEPGLPDDLPADHPLRACEPHQLRVSPVARNAEFEARQELRNLLAGDELSVDVVGYVAGAGGGLALDDLCSLTKAPPRKLDPILRGVFGRSLSTRAANPRGRADPAARVYLFAHATLSVTAEKQLGFELSRYRQAVHDWVKSFADANWPASSPRYAIESYPSLLAATGDTTRLYNLARDPRRHAFLLTATGNEFAALAEIKAAQQLLLHNRPRDLKALAELAAYQLNITRRGEALPRGIIVMWRNSAASVMPRLWRGLSPSR